jgi:hypothetical protein
VSALTETIKDLVPVVLGLGGAASLAWRFIESRVARSDKREDDEKTRLVKELRVVRKERDDARQKAEEMTARWIREIQLGAQRAVSPAPAHPPRTLPPPPFREPEPIQKIRETVESKTLQRIRRGEPDPNSEDTITGFNVEQAVAPVKPEQPAEYRPKQQSFSVREVDGRRKPDRR